MPFRPATGFFCRDQRYTAPGEQLWYPVGSLAMATYLGTMASTKGHGKLVHHDEQDMLLDSRQKAHYNGYEQK